VVFFSFLAQTPVEIIVVGEKVVSVQQMVKNESMDSFAIVQTAKE